MPIFAGRRLFWLQQQAILESAAKILLERRDEMEKKKSKKLILCKETVRLLEEGRLAQVGGGLKPTEGWIRTGNPCDVQECVVY